jgi:hypothetical protein
VRAHDINPARLGTSKVLAPSWRAAVMLHQGHDPQQSGNIFQRIEVVKETARSRLMTSGS